MQLYELMLTSVALSADAFAAAVCRGLSMGQRRLQNMLSVGLWFGLFQALMPFVGYTLGGILSDSFERYSSWIAFALLALIGGGMIRESLSHSDRKENTSSGTSMAALALATSIDALAVGVAFAMVRPYGGIGLAVTLIGITTFVLSAVGTGLGTYFGSKYRSRAELAGGIILIVIGIKLVAEQIMQIW